MVGWLVGWVGGLGLKCTTEPLFPEQIRRRTRVHQFLHPVDEADNQTLYGDIICSVWIHE